MPEAGQSAHKSPLENDVVERSLLIGVVVPKGSPFADEFVICSRPAASYMSSIDNTNGSKNEELFPQFVEALPRRSMFFLRHV